MAVKAKEEMIQEESIFKSYEKLKRLLTGDFPSGIPQRQIDWILHTKSTFGLFMRDPSKAQKAAKGEWKAMVAGIDIEELNLKFRSILSIIQVDHLFMSDQNVVLHQDLENNDTSYSNSGQIASGQIIASSIARGNSIISVASSTSSIPAASRRLSTIPTLAENHDTTEMSLAVPMPDSIFYSLEHDIDLIPHIEEIIRQDDTRKGLEIDTEDIANTMQSNSTGINGNDPRSSLQISTSFKNNSPLPSLGDPGSRYLLKMIHPAFQKSASLIVESVRVKKIATGNGSTKATQMERVIQALKEYEPHSRPFLRPVQKKEAPTYYDYIKHPMDLSTMYRKLKSSTPYATKSEFVHDLNLIWANCIFFNINQDSPYRYHAEQMRKKATELLKKVIDDIVSEEGELVEKTESIVKAEPGVISDGILSVALSSVISTSVPPASVSGVSASAVSIASSEHQDDDMDIDEEEDQLEDEPQLDFTTDDCPLTSQWKSATNVYRARRLKHYMQHLQLPFGERLTIPLDFDPYLVNFARWSARQGIINPGDNGTFLPELYKGSLPQPFEPDSVDALFLQYDDIPSSPIPQAPQPSLAEYDRMQLVLCPWNMTIMQNISTLKKIKTLHSKITNAVEDERLPPIPFRKSWLEDKLPPFNLDAVSATRSLEGVVGFLITHAGFDAVTKPALIALCDILADFVVKSGKTLRAFCDSEMSHSMTDLEILEKALAEIGSTGSCLKSYLSGVDRIGNKVFDLSKRLESGWAELSSGADGDTLVPEAALEIDVDQNEDEIMRGAFLEDLGVDFLNIKELGLDFNIPDTLWNRRFGNNNNKVVAHVKKSFFSTSANDGESPESVFRVYPTPVNWDPLIPSEQIRLLGPFYDRLGQVPDGLVEDDDKPRSKEDKKFMLKIAQAGGRKFTAAGKRGAVGGGGSDKGKANKKPRKKVFGIN